MEVTLEGFGVRLLGSFQIGHGRFSEEEAEHASDAMKRVVFAHLRQNLADAVFKELPDAFELVEATFRFQFFQLGESRGQR